eukprot:CFRG5001T1
MIRSIITAFAIIVARATFSHASCSITKCGSIDPVDIMTYFTDAYVVQDLTGSWHQVFAMDNTATSSSQNYTEKYTIGYTETESTKTTTEWTAEAGVAFKAVTIKAGYTSTVELYDSTSWSTSVEKTLSISVPAYSYANVLQRQISSDLTWTDKVCAYTGFLNQYQCMQPQDGYILYWMGPKDSEEYCGKCAVMELDTYTSITLGFDTNCYANTVDMDQANAFCPVYSASTLLQAAKTDGTLYYEDIPSNVLSQIVTLEYDEEDDNSTIPGRRSADDA